MIQVRLSPICVKPFVNSLAVWLSLLCTLLLNRAHGTEYVATQLTNINPSGDSYPHTFGELNGQLVFSASDGATRQLFRTNGYGVEKIAAATGDHVHLDFNPTTAMLNGQLFFDAFASNAPGLFKTDGNSITKLADVELSRPDDDVTIPPILVPFGNRLYFPGNRGSGWDLYYTDGTTVGQVEFDHIGDVYTGNFQGFRNSLYFDACFLSNGSCKLFKTDGISAVEVIADPAGLRVEFNGELYFAGQGIGGRKLFRTNGAILTEMNASLFGFTFDSFAVFGDVMYFMARSNDGYHEIYRTDGNTVARFDLPSRDQSDAAFLGVFKNELYFRGRGPRGQTLFKTDGATVDEVMLLSNAGHYVKMFGVQHDDLYFETESLYNGRLRRGIYKTDGESVTFVDANQGASYVPQNITFFQDSIYFTALGPLGEELFRITDDSLVDLDINPMGDSSPSGLVVLDGELYFAARGTAGRELYKTDGSLLTLIDINPNGSSNPGDMRLYGHSIVMSASVSNGVELFIVTRVIPEPPTIVLALTALMSVRLLRYRRSF